MPRGKPGLNVHRTKPKPAEVPLPAIRTPKDAKPRVNADVMAILQAASPKAAKKLIQLLEAKSEDMQFKAALAIMDRVCGKPVQRQEVTGKDGGPMYIVTSVDRDPSDSAIDVTPAQSLDSVKSPALIELEQALPSVHLPPNVEQSRISLSLTEDEIDIASVITDVASSLPV